MAASTRSLPGVENGPGVSCIKREVGGEHSENARVLPSLKQHLRVWSSAGQARRISQRRYVAVNPHGLRWAVLAR